jgi:CHAT domain-containing protein
MRRGLVRVQKLILAIPVVFSLVAGRDARIPESQRLLAAADRFAMLYNWPKAAPLYAKAESLLVHANDRKRFLFARLGYLWVTADAGVTPAATEEVADYLNDSVVRTDPNVLLRALVAKAVLDRNRNEIAARESWNQILNLAQRLHDTHWERRAKAEIGQILYMDGNVESATVMFRDALESQYWHLDLAPAIYYTAMVGNGAAESGRAETALQYCDIALRISGLVRDGGFPYLAYQGKARALISLGRSSEALIVLNSAIKQARKEGNSYALAQLLVVSGIATKSTNSTGAIQYLSEAVELSEWKGFEHVFSWSSIQLASVYKDTGHIEAAASLAARAVATVRDLEDRYHLPEDLTLLADLESRKGNAKRSDELYSEATDVIDALLVNLNTDQLKGSLISQLSDAYVGHFRLVATKLQDSSRAFEIIENARGRELSDNLRGDSRSLTSADERTIAAVRDINRIQLALLHATNSTERSVLLDVLFGEEQLLAPVRNRNPGLISNAHRFKPVAVADFQRSLHSDEIVLEYVLDEPFSFCLRITPSDNDVITLSAGRKRIEGLVDEYLDAARSRNSETSSSQELFSVLLKPVLIGKGSRNRLIVVPDGKLHLLPFDGLTDTKGKYVLESRVVTYAPSATVLDLLRKARPTDPAKMSFLGIGGVSYSDSRIAATDRGPASADFFGIDPVAFSNLPGSRQEVTSIASMVPGPSKVLVGATATEASFKMQSLADYRVIHLAVHGVASVQFPDRAALVLGNGSASGEDGLLQAREIRDLDLRADLVVLSACETGSGKLLGEEGIASLERAFLLAGAKSVIASLWTADDTYTIALMNRLYRHLVDGSDKGTALQQAKLDLLKEFGEQALPIYWAGFTLVGDGSTPVFK